MVIVSHKHKFIYLKTFKTGSTTIHDFITLILLNYDLEKAQEIFGGAEILNDDYIISTRIKPNCKRFHAHQSASSLKKELDKIDKNIWNDYFKFTSVRNTYDQLVSHYYQFKSIQRSSFRNIVLKQIYNHIKYKSRNPFFLLKMLHKRLRFYYNHKIRFNKNITFEQYLMKFKLRLDKEEKYLGNLRIYSIDDIPQCDYYIHRENLFNDLKHVLNHLGLNPDYSHFKSKNINKRPENDKYKKYYTEELVEIVKKQFKKEIDFFNYEF